MLASEPVRPPVSDIAAPPFPPRLEWVNVARLRMDQQLGRPVLIEFWDFCRVNSLRTLPYVKAWHRRYAGDGLRVIGVHTGGFAPSQRSDEVRAAVLRLGIDYAVVIDAGHEIWQVYENQGWPARYLFDQRGLLFDYHYGEGAYAETESAIAELLDVRREPVAPLRPGDEPGALLPAQTADQPGAYSGPYEAGGVWAVLDGRGTITVNGRPIAVEHAGCHALIEHERHTVGELEIELSGGLICHATCFTPAPA